MRGLAPLLVIAGVSTAWADPPAPVEARHMVGPFPSVAAICRAHRCGVEEVEPGERVRAQRACEPIERAKVIGPFLEAKLYAFDCRTPGIRDASHTTHLLVRRTDGWWRSEPLFSSGGNDKYCDDAIETRFEPRSIGAAEGLALVSRVTTECVACGKQGSERTGQEVLTIVADRADGPRIWTPILIGQHYRQRADEDAPPEVVCPTRRYDARRSLGWSSDAVILGAHARWFRMPAPGGALDDPYAVRRNFTAIGEERLELRP